MVFTLRPSAHLRSLATGVGFGTISAVQTSLGFVQGGVVKTFRCRTETSSMPSYYDLSPAEGVDCLTIDEVVSRVAETFPEHEISAEAAQADAKKRLATLEAVNASEGKCFVSTAMESRFAVESPNPTRSNSSNSTSGRIRECTPIPSRVMSKNCCLALANKLADLLGYRLSCEEYD